jgi:hypothetical protein
MPKLYDRLRGLIRGKEERKESLAGDAEIGIAFVAAIAVLLLVAGYVISRMSSDRAYREKWKDYNDCGWA